MAKATASSLMCEATAGIARPELMGARPPAGAQRGLGPSGAVDMAGIAQERLDLGDAGHLEQHPNGVRAPRWSQMKLERARAHREPRRARVGHQWRQKSLTKLG